MTPAARYAAAIEILDATLEGKPTEQALLNWTRGHRFAGSKDRAAIRDVVFSIARRRASCAAIGGALSGRAMVRGYLAQLEIPEDEVFGVGGYSPTEISNQEPPLQDLTAAPESVQLDLQEWVFKQLSIDHTQAREIAQSLRNRAPVWMRVNTARTTPDEVFKQLQSRGYGPQATAPVPSAIKITERARQLAQDPLILSGLLEFQDLGPQSACDLLNVEIGQTVLDFCSGGGGKALALAAKGAHVCAYDIAPERMVDLPMRAKRAGADIEIAKAPKGLFDVVVVDVPCSGSGAWRRAVDGKWALTPEDLTNYTALQQEIVTEAAAHMRPGGQLVYMTCSLFAQENTEMAKWISEAGLGTAVWARQWTPLDDCDGFYCAVFQTRK